MRVIHDYYHRSKFLNEIDNYNRKCNYLSYLFERLSNSCLYCSDI